MRITVNLYAWFRSNRFESKGMEFPEETMLGQVALELGIPVSQVGISLLNGTHAPLGAVLQDGDTVSLLPLIGGG